MWSRGFNHTSSFSWKEPCTRMERLERTRETIWFLLARTTPMSGPWEKSMPLPPQMPAAWPGCTTHTSTPLRTSALGSLARCWCARKVRRFFQPPPHHPANSLLPGVLQRVCKPRVFSGLPPLLYTECSFSSKLYVRLGTRKLNLTP